MIDRVLVPMDDSEMAKRALEYALAVHDDAEITVLHVAGAPSGMMGEAAALTLTDDADEAVKEAASEVFDRAHEIAGEREISTETRVGHPARAILDHAEGFDAVIVGSHGGSLLDRLLVGNVAEEVFRHSPVPVTVVR
jgi:nucleotide-binding universal stress UspA family protein